MQEQERKQIKKILIRFRQELEIKKDKIKLSKEEFQYLLGHKLIDDVPGANYYWSITPAGFNWDVDLGRVRMPDYEENIMKRDLEVLLPSQSEIL